MVNETVRIYRRALEHESYGVNAKLPGVPRFPEDPEPRQVKRVLEVTRDKVASGRVTFSLPAVLVAVPGEFDVEPEVMTGKRDTTTPGIPVAIGFAVEKAAEGSPQRITEAWYLLRAAMRSVREVMKTENADERLENDVQVRDAVRMRVLPNPVEIADTGVLVACALVVYTLVRDKEP